MDDETPGVDCLFPRYRPYEEVATKNMIYDTEVAAPGSLFRKELNYFVRPLGHPDVSGFIPSKSQAETNLLMDQQLPMPRSFTGGFLRLGMPLSVPFIDRMRAYCLGVLRLVFQHRIIWDGPLKVIPCGLMVEFEEEMPESEALFRPVDEEQQEKLGLAFGPRTLKQQDTLQARICWPCCATREGEPRPELEGHVPISLYMFGEIWEPRLER